MDTNNILILHGDCLQELKKLPDESVHCCVTSPPYWMLRDYGVAGQIGLEETMDLYIQKIVEIFREIRRVLRKDGTLWLNIGDSYCSTAPGTVGDNIHIEGALEATRRARKLMRPQTPTGLKHKDLMGMPWRVAFALQADGWYLRSDIIWHKSNPMPESVKDRPTKSHEYVFLFSKSPRYYYDFEVVKEPCVGSDNRPPAGSKGAFGEPQARRREYAAPTGWDTDAGAHGSFHKEGRRLKGNRKTFRGGGTYTNNQAYDNSTEVENDSIGNTANQTGLRNRRTVWTVATQACKVAHFATFPEKLIEPCILAGCPEGGTVIDPFFGSGTTGLVARKLKRNCIGIEINGEYIEIAEERLKKEVDGEI